MVLKNMNTSITGVAKRLTFSLIAASALVTLGGCAVYGPAYGPATATYTDADGKVVTTTVQTVPPPVVNAPYVYVNPYPYYPYAYDPWLYGPPVYFNFGIGGGGRWHGGGGRYRR